MISLNLALSDDDLLRSVDGETFALSDDRDTSITIGAYKQVVRCMSRKNLDITLGVLREYTWKGFDPVAYALRPCPWKEQEDGILRSC